jgi:hypothetical protein
MTPRARRLLGVFVTGAALLSVSGESAAWTKYKNKTPNTISTVHGFASGQAFGCGFDDGCRLSGDDLEDFRIRGWFNIAPGGSVTVETHAFHNSAHIGYAEDNFGHVWNSNLQQICISNNAFDVCGSNCPGSGTPRRVSPFQFRNARCCGFTCSPVDFTLNFTL